PACRSARQSGAAPDPRRAPPPPSVTSLPGPPPARPGRSRPAPGRAKRACGAPRHGVRVSSVTETGERRRGTAARTTTRDSGVRNARDAAQRAAELLSGLIRHRLEGVSAVSRDEDDGWTVHVDVLEVPRIP